MATQLSPTDRSAPAGAVWAMLAATFFSANDVMTKLLSGGYPLYEVIFIRSIVAILLLLVVLVPLTGTREMLKTRRPGAHALRGACLVFANFFFFLGLAALPIAEAVAIFFVSPFLVSVFSKIFLSEPVGPRRWLAVALGMAGALIVLRPGTSAFQIAALLPLIAASGYAMMNTMTRKIGATENPTALAFYLQLSFLLVSSLAGIALGHGRFNVIDHPSAEFLLRGWAVPTAGDLALILTMGATSVLGGYSASQAYSRSPSALVAPFEYLGIPLSIFWGITVFHTFPDGVAILGIVLILVSGIGLALREAALRRRIATPRSARM